MLNVSGCQKRKSILGQFTKLTELYISGCLKIRELPGAEHFISLYMLDVGGCEKLDGIPRLGQLTKLIDLNVQGCSEMQELPGVEHLISLDKLKFDFFG